MLKLHGSSMGQSLIHKRIGGYSVFLQTAHTHISANGRSCVLMKQSDSFRQRLTLSLLLAFSSMFLLFWHKLTTTASPRSETRLYETNLSLK